MVDIMSEIQRLYVMDSVGNVYSLEKKDGIYEDVNIISYIEDGKVHRLDGPALIFKNKKEKRWVINGYECPQIHDFAKEYNIDLENLSMEDKFLIRLYFENYQKE